MSGSSSTSPGSAWSAPADGDAALEAFDRYGKGRNHPAQLNLADCFAYAMAKNRRVSLLFKGYDFDKTDIADGR
jgi:ribonuclease VapC